MYLRRMTATVLALTALHVMAAQQSKSVNTEEPQRQYVRESTLAERDFPFFSALRMDDTTRITMGEDATLSRIATERWRAVAAANKDCKEDLHCKAEALKFNDQQVEEISTGLRQMYQQNDSLKKFTRRVLEDHEEFSLDKKKGADLVVDNWRRSATALNNIIATYCGGSKPRYGEIDSMTYKVDSRTYAALIRIIVDELPIEESAGVSHANREKALFFEPALRFALRLLQANSRDEAGRFWPLGQGENHAAVARSKGLKWAGFSYSMILIPGAGSEVPAVSISPWGRERLRLGVEAYRAGKAPFIMVSGGFVHPSQTPFCEAMEMKLYLMQVYGIPEGAILLEPQARHTTTNLRNGVRQIIAYNLPITKPMLIVSDAAQSSYISSETFEKRTIAELGYQPVTLGKRLSPTQLEALPSKSSLFVDPLDPLDP